MQDIMPRLISFFGLWVMLLLAWALSENRKRVHVRLIVTGLLFQPLAVGRKSCPRYHYATRLQVQYEEHEGRL